MIGRACLVEPVSLDSQDSLTLAFHLWKQNLGSKRQKPHIAYRIANLVAAVVEDNIIGLHAEGAESEQFCVFHIFLWLGSQATRPAANPLHPLHPTGLPVRSGLPLLLITGLATGKKRPFRAFSTHKVRKQCVSMANYRVGRIFLNGCLYKLAPRWNRTNNPVIRVFCCSERVGPV
jgi:hypothetical protein